MALIWHHENQVVEKTAEAVVRYLNQCTEEREPVLLLISGGSWLSILDFVEIPAHADVTISVVDERFSDDPEINNFAQITQTKFYHQIEERALPVISTLVTPGENRDLHAARFEDALREWRSDHPRGRVLALLGMGPDGHTAGIFSGVYSNEVMQSTFFDSQQWVHAYTVPFEINPYPERITVTGSFLVHVVDAAILFVQGESKCKILADVHDQRYPVEKQPIQLVHQMALVDIFTDCV